MSESINIRGGVDPATNSFTYFFREPDPLCTMRDTVVLPRASAARPVALWSVGCATGEEAYTVAILAAEAGVEIEILGSDAQQEAIEAARRGVYSARSLRYVDGPRRRSWFDRTDPGGFSVAAGLRGQVRFVQHNAIAEEPLRPAGRTGLWDVILCRNVLLYYQEHEIARCLSHLLRVLSPDGLLILGTSEWLSTRVLSQVASPARLECAIVDQLFAYRRVDPQWGPGPRSIPPSGSVPPTRDLPRPHQRGEGRRSATPEVVVAPSPAAPETPASEAVSMPVTRLAALRQEGDGRLDRGDNEGALAAYSEAVALDPLLPDLHFRQALCYLALGRDSEARAGLRRSLFLEPDLWSAAMILGEMLVVEDKATARRYLEQARDALQRAGNRSAAATPVPSMSPFLCGEQAAREAIRLRLTSLD